MITGNEEKIMALEPDPEYREVPDQVSEDEQPYSWRAAANALKTEAERQQDEDDFRVRMVALDMANAALPQFDSSINNEATRVRVHNELIKRFETYLRTGELNS